MATTTTNFGWDIPQSTDLVKDGATAIAALGQDIDTAFIDLKGGTTGQVLAKASNTDLDYSWVAQDDSNAIQNAIVDAKGDLIAATAADTPARLAVGTNGQVLQADSTAATGLKWATPAAGGGFTLISSTALTGASVTLSSIPQTYKRLYAVAYGITNAGGAGFFRIAPNGTTNITTLAGLYNNTTPATDGSFNSYLQVGRGNSTTGGANVFVVTIDNYTSSTNYKAAQIYGVMFDSGSNNDAFTYTGGITTNTAITSLVVSHSGGNFNAGTIDLYGEN